MDPTQMSPQQQAMLMALIGGGSTAPTGMTSNMFDTTPRNISNMGGGMTPPDGSGGMPPTGVMGQINSMGGGMPMQQQPGGPVSPYASMLGVQPPQGY